MASLVNALAINMAISELGSWGVHGNQMYNTATDEVHYSGPHPVFLVNVCSMLHQDFNNIQPSIASSYMQ